MISKTINSLRPLITSARLVVKLIKKRIEKDLHDQSGYILNIPPTALRDRNFMADLLSFLTYRKEVARQLIFEMPQSAYETLSDGTLAIVKGLGKIGCRFSMDRFHSTKINIDFLRNAVIRFIKMDSLWMLREMQTQHGIRRLCPENTPEPERTDLTKEKIEAEEVYANCMICRWITDKAICSASPT